MGYFSWKEDEAYRDGYNDGRYSRRDYFRDQYFGAEPQQQCPDGDLPF